MSKLNEFQKKAIISISVILLYFLWPTITQLPLKLAGIQFEQIADQNTPVSEFLYNIVFNFLFLAFVVFVYRKTLLQGLKKWKENGQKNSLTILKYTLVEIAVIFVVNTLKIILFSDQVANNDLANYQYFQELPWMMAFMTIIYYPIVEEIVFKKTLKDLIVNKWAFILLSSLFFWYFNIAFNHIDFTSIVNSLYYFAGSIVFSYAYYKTDNLLVPIGSKMLYNVFVTLVSII